MKKTVFFILIICISLITILYVFWFIGKPHVELGRNITKELGYFSSNYLNFKWKLIARNGILSTWVNQEENVWIGVSNNKLVALCSLTGDEFTLRSFHAGKESVAVVSSEEKIKTLTYYTLPSGTKLMVLDSNGDGIPDSRLDILNNTVEHVSELNWQQKPSSAR